MAKQGEVVSTPQVNEALGDAELWLSFDWKAAEADVRRLRQRIFKAAQDGDLKRLRSLQRLMLRSRSNLVISVRRVTQRSLGRRTPGIDGELALSHKARGSLVRTLGEVHAADFRPVRRVHIPKANGKLRPLGIPVIRDRVQQARVLNALEPEWEARFEARSYGFRPGRSCQDAMAAIFTIIGRKSALRPWVLDADLSSAFDRINHECLLETIDGFPAATAVRRWLRAGVMENGRFAPTEEGAPQGGVISPLLLNIALHGLSMAAGEDDSLSDHHKRKRPMLVRYADDFVVFCSTEEEAFRIKGLLAAWLKPKGLTFNEEKTSVRHVTEGFDFLGFSFRKYGSGKLVIKPSRAAVTRVKEKVREMTRGLATAPTEIVIKQLNPLIKGWSTYYRGAVSSETFSTLENFMYKRMYRWAKRRHPKKSATWVKANYFGAYHPGRKDRWVFGDRKSGRYLQKFSWTKIVRHVPVIGRSSRDDPNLKEYWAKRTAVRPQPIADRMVISLAARQKGVCPLCGLDLIAGAGYEPDSVREWAEWFTASRRTINRHHLVYRSHGGADEKSNLVLIHADCHRRHHAANDRHTPEETANAML
ncbi:group II intron reverse transcriptase/maturase [Kitasatospora sp. NPDC097605]|uniref:group II intron reverse transcriptase/maturase n=1 Tax=Kitasatospora sp. NPDC097605 TaxID=3157226 RepID=UPI003325D0AF